MTSSAKTQPAVVKKKYNEAMLCNLFYGLCMYVCATEVVYAFLSYMKASR